MLDIKLTSDDTVTYIVSSPRRGTLLAGSAILQLVWIF
jgi:hypothetical protein